jgi:hypothetical protein
MALAAEKAGASQQIDWGSFELFFERNVDSRRQRYLIEEGCMKMGWRDYGALFGAS